MAYNEYPAGQAVTVKTDVVNDALAPADAAAVTLEFRAPDGTVTTKHVGDLAHPGVGDYRYTIPTAAGQEGVWTYSFWTSAPNSFLQNAFVVLPNLVDDPPAPADPPLGPPQRPTNLWVDNPEECCTFGAALSPARQQLVLEAASEILWKLSGRQFGYSTVDVRPCRRPHGWNHMVGWNPVFSFPSVPFRFLGNWTNIWCACLGVCDCSAAHQFELPRRPVAEITQVKVDGVVLDESKYRLDENRWLVRLDGHGWPLKQNLDLADTEVGTWSVGFTHGRPIPAQGKLAAYQLTCEMMKGCNGDACALPDRIVQVTRENLNYALLNPQDFLKEGRTGMYDVDLFLATVNPHKLQRRGRVYRADAPRTSRRVGS